MIEIARNYKVEYDPDPTMFMVRNGKVVIIIHSTCVGFCCAHCPIADHPSVIVGTVWDDPIQYLQQYNVNVNLGPAYRRTRGFQR